MQRPYAYRIVLVLFAGLISGCAGRAGTSPAVYYPGPGDEWMHQAPETLGVNAALLEEATAFAQNNKTSMPTDLKAYLSRSDDPHDEIVGPTRERGDMSGIILKGGYIVAEWGDTKRVDMTFSVTKSFLS
ncbi:MAG: serine hydrolase, partial [Rhodothermales bacterium]